MASNTRETEAKRLRKTRSVGAARRKKLAREGTTKSKEELFAKSP